jgi:hypothetical protein
MEAGALAGLLVGLIVLLVVLTSRARARIRAALSAVATAHGLPFQDGRLERRIEGTKEGHAVQIVVNPSQRNPNSVLQQAWRIFLAYPPPEGFGATKNGWRTQASPGTVRVMTGDATLDGELFIESPWPDGARPWLTPARLAALRVLIHAGGLLHGGAVLFHKVGLETKPGKLLERFDTLYKVVLTLERG